MPKFLDTSILRQPSACSPEGPAAPFVCRAALAIVDSSMIENMAGSTNGTCPAIKISLSASIASGCFALSSRNVSSDNLRTPDVSSNNLMAALTLPESITIFAFSDNDSGVQIRLFGFETIAYTSYTEIHQQSLTF